MICVDRQTLMGDGLGLEIERAELHTSHSSRKQKVKQPSVERVAVGDGTSPSVISQPPFDALVLTLEFL